MAKSKSKRASAAAPYIRRALEDEYAQEQLRKAVSRLRDVYARVSREQAAAAEDRRLYRSLKDAAVSIRKAVGRIEEPPKPKHTLRIGLLGGIAVGGMVVLVVKRKRKRDADLPREATADYSGQAAGTSARPEPASAPA